MNPLTTGHRSMRTLGVLVLLSAGLLACGGDDNSDAVDTTETTAGSTSDETTTTDPPDDDEETTTTEASSGSGDDTCPVSADEVSGAIGATVLEGGSAMVELAIPDPAIRGRADIVCIFTPDGATFGIPLVSIISSDDPEAEFGARSLLSGDEAAPIEAVGDEALVDNDGALVFRVGDTWTSVSALVAASDTSANQEAAVAVARLVGG